MVRSRSLIAACIAFAVVSTACSGGDDTVATTVAPTTTAAPATTTSAPSTTTTAPTTTTATPTTTTTTAAPVDDGSLVGVPSFDSTSCGIGPEPDFGDYEYTFVRNGFLLAADSDGAAVRCIAPIENQDRVVWGPGADQLLTGTTRLSGIDAFADVIGGGAVFTRPTGRNMVWVEDGALWKASVDGTNAREISFLPEHTAVTYHPAGVEIATIGIDADGRYGVWISKNDGTDAQRVVTAAEATVTEVAFSESSGFFLSFVAEHEDGTRHLHELTLIDADGLAVRNEFDASIALETDRSLHGLVANPWTDEIAVTEGSCDDPEGPRARLAWGGDLPEPLAGMATEAIGWVPNFDLLVAAYPEGCDGPRELWTVETGFGMDTAEPLLVVRDVGLSAIRTVFPDPPKPLGEIDLDDFA